MSKAIKCDKCGTCMCPDDTDEKMVTFNHVGATDGTMRNENTFKMCRVHVDLCPECSKQFFKFMNMEEEIDG